MTDPTDRERESQEGDEDKFHEAREDEREERDRQADELQRTTDEPE
jgi:hypothetical protein